MSEPDAGSQSTPSGHDQLWRYGHELWTRGSGAAQAGQMLHTLLSRADNALAPLGPNVAGRSHADDDIDRVTTASRGLADALLPLSDAIGAQRWDEVDVAAATVRRAVADLDVVVAQELPDALGARMQDIDWLLDDIARLKLPRMLRALVEPSTAACDSIGQALDALAPVAAATAEALELEPVGQSGAGAPSENRIPTSTDSLGRLRQKLASIESIAFEMPEEDDDEIRHQGADAFGANPWAHLAIQPVTSYTPGAGNIW